MFYDSTQSLLYMVVLWTILTIIFGLALHLSLKLAHIELNLGEELVVIGASSLVALFPVIGPLLAFIVAIFLIHRMSDSNLGIIIAAVIVTRYLAMILAIVSVRGLVTLGIVR